MNFETMLKDAFEILKKENSDIKDVKIYDCSFEKDSYSCGPNTSAATWVADCTIVISECREVDELNEVKCEL